MSGVTIHIHKYKYKESYPSFHPIAGEAYGLCGIAGSLIIGGIALLVMQEDEICPFAASLLGGSAICNIASQIFLISSRATQYYLADSWNKERLDKDVFPQTVESGNFSKILSFFSLLGSGIAHCLRSPIPRERFSTNFPFMRNALLAQSGLFYLFAKYCEYGYKKQISEEQKLK